MLKQGFAFRLKAWMYLERKETASAKLSAIPIRSDELRARMGSVQKGFSYDDVSRLLGGEPFKTENREGKKAYFWRFDILDSQEPQFRYEIYLGEFEGERLVFGAPLPRGSA